MSCVLLRHAQGNVLFDTGCHPSVPDDPEARWGAGMVRIMQPIMKSGDNVIGALGGIGVSPDDIDVVVCSHLHPDHCGCNTFFKRATFIAHAREIEAARAPKAVEAGYLAAEWEQDAPIDAIDGERDLFGDGRIVLLPLPGHTPGTTGALVGARQIGRIFARRPTRSACARRSIPASFRAIPGTRNCSRNHWRRSGISKRTARRSSAATTRRNGPA